MPRVPGARSSLAACLCGALLQLSPAASAQSSPAGAAATSDAEIALITFGRGSQVHQYFGHNALVVRRRGRPAQVVNYGMFHFGPGMIGEFLRGRLSFWVGSTDLEATVRHYAAENRDVRLHWLSLTDAQTRSVLDRLEHDMRPENRVYLYDHYHDNCSTRVRDILDRALGGELSRRWSARGRYTLREQTRRYASVDPIVEWLMMFGLSDAVDRPMRRWDDAFIPEELERLLGAVRVPGPEGASVPLLGPLVELHRARPAPPVPALRSRAPQTLALGVAVALCGLWLGSRGRRRAFLSWSAAVGLTVGALGTLLSAMWAFSDHAVTYGNENLFLANPLWLAAGVLSLVALGGHAGAWRWLLALWSALAALALLPLALHALSPSFDQDISLTSALLLPQGLAAATACWLVARRGQSGARQASAIGTRDARWSGDGAQRQS